VTFSPLLFCSRVVVGRFGGRGHAFVPKKNWERRGAIRARLELDRQSTFQSRCSMRPHRTSLFSLTRICTVLDISSSFALGAWRGVAQAGTREPPVPSARFLHAWLGRF
jgi:hypothetical protein